MLERLDALIGQIELAVIDQSSSDAPAPKNSFTTSGPQPTAPSGLPCFGHPSMTFASASELTEYLEAVQNATTSAEDVIDLLRKGGATPDEATCTRAQSFLPIAKADLARVDISRLPQAALHLQDCRYEPGPEDLVGFNASGAAEAAKGWFANYNNTVFALSEWERQCAE